MHIHLSGGQLLALEAEALSHRLGQMAGMGAGGGRWRKRSKLLIGGPVW